jgi:hypothetical protein
MKNNKLLPLVLLAFSQSLLAQQLPRAGGQMQQIPSIPSPPKAVPQLEVQPAEAVIQSPADTARIEVQQLRVTGAHDLFRNGTARAHRVCAGQRAVANRT